MRYPGPHAHMLACHRHKVCIKGRIQVDAEALLLGVVHCPARVGPGPGQAWSDPQTPHPPLTADKPGGPANPSTRYCKNIRSLLTAMY